MSKKYSELSLKEIRDLLLSGELIHENMEREDYAILIDNELEMAEPNNEVVRLCAAELGKYDEFEKLDEINIDVQKIIKSFVVPNNSARKYRKAKRIVFIAAAIVAALFATQLVASAMGFDIFGYIFNWQKEQLVISYNTEQVSEELVPTHTTYEDFFDIPREIRELVPKNLVENFEFAFASVYVEANDKYSHSFIFKKDTDTTITLSLIVSKGQDVYIEKDDEYFEKYVVNEKEFTIYKNLKNIKVIWDENGILYDLGVNLTIDEVKEIIDDI